MAGYYGYSMSNNAVYAYLDNKMPISKWSKKKIFEVIEEKLQDEDFREEYPISNEIIEKLKKVPLKILKVEILVSNEWHHTSKFYNCTDFYEVDFDYIMDLTTEKIEKWSCNF